MALQITIDPQLVYYLGTPQKYPFTFTLGATVKVLQHHENKVTFCPVPKQFDHWECEDRVDWKTPCFENDPTNDIPM